MSQIETITIDIELFESLNKGKIQDAFAATPIVDKHELNQKITQSLLEARVPGGKDA